MNWLIKGLAVVFLFKAIDCAAPAVSKAEMAKYERQMSQYYKHLPKSDKKAIENDPLVVWNQIMFFVNEMLGSYFFDPTVAVYKAITTKGVRSGVNNWLNNLDESKYIIWYSLQFSPKSVTRSISRFFINTIFGVGGLFDVAGAFGVKRKVTSFDKALGVWSVPSGPYVVLPVFGPNTVRSSMTIAHSYGVFKVRLEAIKLVKPANNFMHDPYISNTKIAMTPLKKYMDASPYMEIFARSLNPYAKVKSMYLQRQAFEILGKRYNLSQGKE